MRLRRINWCWRFVLICALVIGVVPLIVSRAEAFADTIIRSYSAANVYNQANGQQDSQFAPYHGSIWGDDFVNQVNPQYIQAENFNLQWSGGTLGNIRSAWSSLGPVFHVLNGDTGNCASYFDYDGVFETNAPLIRVYAKNADCSFFGNGHNNEVRMLWDVNGLAADAGYYGGAEFVLQDGGLWIGNHNHVSNDIYFNDGGQKDNIRNGTWCFDGANNHLWAC